MAQLKAGAGRGKSKKAMPVKPGAVQQLDLFAVSAGKQPPASDKAAKDSGKRKPKRPRKSG